MVEATCVGVSCKCHRSKTSFRRAGHLTCLLVRGHASWDELVVENVSLTFNKGRANEYRALENATMKVRRGEFYCLLGPSGCGKSTILNLSRDLHSPIPASSGWTDNELLMRALNASWFFRMPQVPCFPGCERIRMSNLG